MNTVVSWVLLTVAASNGGDAVTACRAAHESDPRAHIACLEDALRRDGKHTPAPGLGAEQVDRGKNLQAPDPVEVEIVSVDYDREGRHVFVMADGQVWRETESGPESRRLASRAYKARIERGKVRGYRMYVDGVRRMIKVERLK